MKRGVVLSILGAVGMMMAAQGARVAHAASLPDEGPELPGVQGGVSTDSEIRQVDANIDDWQNEQAKAEQEQRSSCRDSNLIHLVWPNGLVPSPPVQLPPMPRLMSQPFTDAQDVAFFLRQAFEGVQLSSTERIRLGNLLNRPIRSDLDLIQLAASAQSLAISVSNRIYSQAIETYYQRTVVEAEFGKIYTEEDTCTEDTLRLERDSVMIPASQLLVELYQQQSAATVAAIEQQPRSLN